MDENSFLRIFSKINIKKAFQKCFILECLIFFYLLFMFKNIVHSETTYVSGRISFDTVWSASCNPYIVTSTIEIYGDTAAAVQLTIDTGVIIRFESGTGLRVGNGLNKGILRAIGGSVEPERIKWTANTGTPVRGYWGNIIIDDGAADYDTLTGDGTVLENCDIEYGGEYFSSDENIYIYNSSPGIKNCVIRESRANGIRLYETSNSLIEGNTITGNGAYGIYLLNSTPKPVITKNTITNNGNYPIRIYVTAINGLRLDNIYSMNSPDMVEVMGEIISEGYIKFSDTGIPYYINGNIELRYFRADTNVRMEVGEGVEMRIKKDCGIGVGSHAWYMNTYPPELKIKGTVSNPVKITSAEPVPGRGDWIGICFENGNINGLSEIENCEIEYAGKSIYWGYPYYQTLWYGGITLIGGARVNMNGVKIRYSKQHGVYNAGGDLIIDGAEIREND
ncbi:MAG: right-handed parallel beta-helix repeat-containing protein [bacterium]